jgi:transglutaminase-like putative cysteine protease
MNLVALHKRLSYLLVLLPSLILVAGGEMNPLVIALFYAGFVGSWWWEPPRVDLDRWDRVLAGLTVVLLVVTVARLFVLGTIRIDPLVDLVLFLTVIKLFQRKGPRDWVQILALSFLLVTAASAFNEGLVFAAAFVIYTVLGTVTLALKHLLEEATQHEPERLAGFRVEWTFLNTVAGLALLVCLVAGALFLAFPRLGFGFWGNDSASGVMASGFSDEVELGEHGTIREDDTIVMRVTFPDRRGPVNDLELRWRGVAYDHYDGRRWTKSENSGSERQVMSLSSDNIYEFRSEALRNRALVRQDIRLMPINTDVLFGLSTVLGVRFPGEDPELVRVLQRENMYFTSVGEAYLEREHHSTIRYEAFSGLHELAGGLPTASNWQLPEVLSDRVRELTESIVEGIDDPLLRARAIEDYLQRNLTYTLDLPEVNRDNPIEDFLFVAQRGHCEYFATAMALMARTVGLASRSVNGFLGGDWNPIGEYYAVRQSHAHSWVEVYIRGRGWVTFDPTPAAGVPTGAEETLWTGIQAFLDNIRMAWYERVIGYDLEAQIETARGIGRAFSGDRDLVEGVLDAGRALVVNARVIAAQLLLWVGLGWFLSGRNRRAIPWRNADRVATVAVVGGSVALAEALWRPDPGLLVLAASALFPVAVAVQGWASRQATEQGRMRRTRRSLAAVSRIYLKLVRGLARAGYETRPGQSPAALLRQADARGAPYREDLGRTLRLYEDCRFGGSDSPAERRHLRREVARVLGLVRSAG